jgi:hypothetical protein
VKNTMREKWDYLLPAELLNASFASSYLDVSGMRTAVREQDWESISARN